MNQELTEYFDQPLAKELDAIALQLYTFPDG
jgi:hypothetical protein